MTKCLKLSHKFLHQLCVFVGSFRVHELSFVTMAAISPEGRESPHTRPCGRATGVSVRAFILMLHARWCYLRGAPGSHLHLAAAEREHAHARLHPSSNFIMVSPDLARPTPAASAAAQSIVDALKPDIRQFHDLSEGNIESIGLLFEVRDEQRQQAQAAV